MSSRYLVYLSGPGVGLPCEDDDGWRRYVVRCFPAHVVGVSPLRATGFVRDRGVPRIEDQVSMITQRSRKGRNLHDVRGSHAVLVNMLGAQALSIEMVGEMAVAHQLRIPIIAAIEPEGNVHDHPMINEWIDVRVPTLNEAIETTVGMICHTEAEIWTNIRQVEYLMSARRMEVYDGGIRPDSTVVGGDSV
jgi:hypothetical protein